MFTKWAQLARTMWSLDVSAVQLLVWPRVGRPRVGPTVRLERRLSDSPTDRLNHEDVDDRSWPGEDVNGAHLDYILPLLGHRCLVIQPDYRHVRHLRATVFSAENHLSEACALVNSLPDWTVVGCCTETSRSPASETVFGSGKLATLRSRIWALKKDGQITAVFLSVPMLSANGLATLQDYWQIAVYDRFTVVLQIFKHYARSRQAKLQVALAEASFIRARLTAVHRGQLNSLRNSLCSVGAVLESSHSAKQSLFSERLHRIKQGLAQLKAQRQLARRQRRESMWPTVAVVGYTNAGKTALIKRLSRDETITPEDRLFATLDVTAHAVLLNNRLRVTMIDTVGFISELPTRLIAAFEATLQDALEADLIVHVQDVSRVDCIAGQLRVVDETVGTLMAKALMTDEYRDKVIRVGNKIDLVAESDRTSLQDKFGQLLAVSCENGLGLAELSQLIEERLLDRKRLASCTIRLAQSAAQELTWLYKQTSVADVRPCTDDANFLEVSVMADPVRLKQFICCFPHVRRWIKR